MQNRVVIITGASSGIGAATARLLAETSRLVLVARRADRLQEVVQQVEEAGGEALSVVADVTAEGAAGSICDAAIEAFGGISAIINNAGVFRTALGAELDAEHVDSQLAVNLRAPLLLTRAALPHLQAAHGGWIVNVSSVAAEASFSACGVYAATKAGLEAWSRCLREELREQHIRVGVVVPGATDSEVWPEGDWDRTRMCRSEDVARAIAYMLDCPASASIDRIVVTPPGGAL